ncbi:hypothetical protein [Neisseria viridiae]|nr:hypothetical protein [Neisseria viridiae]
MPSERQNAVFRRHFPIQILPEPNCKAAAAFAQIYGSFCTTEA